MRSASSAGRRRVGARSAAAAVVVSETYDTLVVLGAEARYGGSGRVDGDGGYSFEVAAVDGALAGDGIDRFRLVIRHTASGTVVYDSQPGDADTAPATTPLGGGNVTFHPR